MPLIKPDAEFALTASRRFVGVGWPRRGEQRDGSARALDRYLDQPGRRSIGRAGDAGESERAGALPARRVAGEFPIGDGADSAYGAF